MSRTSESHQPETIFRSSQWIWPESLHWDLHNCYALFRKEVFLPKLPTKAPIFLTADQSYQLWVNGRYVCRGPARGFQNSWPYDEVDIHSFLRQGRNVLAVRAHSPGFSNFQYITQGYAGLLVAARWGKILIVSDKTWKCRRQTGLYRDTVPTSLQLFCQEHIDLRAEDPNWMQPEYDDRLWNGLVAEHPWNGMPWHRLEARGIPMLEENILVPKCCVGEADGRCASNYQATRDVTRVRFAEGLGHRPINLGADNLRIPPTGRKRFRSYLIDFQRTEVGSIGLEISGAHGDEIIDTLHGETIDSKNLTLHFQPDKHCRMAFGHRLICRSGSQIHVFHHAFGFRYMVLTVRDSENEITVRPFLRTTLYPLKQTGRFQTSESGLRHIWETCAHTQRVCSLDAYVDTPWREQAQWWGDARVQAWNTFHLSGDTRLFRRGIAQIAAQTTPNGLTYGHAPTMAHNCILPDFSLIWILTLWDFYWQTGSIAPVAVHSQTIDGILEFFRNAIHPATELVQYDPRYWLFLDWTEIQREGCPAVLNLWLLIALDKLAFLYSLRRNARAAADLRRRAAALRKALAGLVDEDGLMHDGFDAAGRRTRGTSVHAQTLALMAGLYPVSDANALQRILLPFIREEKSFVARPSAYWITYVFFLLHERGYGHDVIGYISKYWAPMAVHGTTWENFSPRPGDESFSHAWSAHPLYHFMQILGGIRQAAPAWKKIVFQPEFIGHEAETTIPTPQGAIHSAWRRRGSGTDVRLELPKGISAEIVLPGTLRQTVRGKARWSLETI